jgi:tRNA threonylcarbamoyladenosine biosynthesis protein TsaE
MKFELQDESATVALGERLGGLLVGGLCIYLEGDLGAGKTTLTRGLLKSKGHSSAVKSPTYTLVEQYQFDQLDIYHFDLYRLADPEELDFVGIRDYFHSSAVCLVEWAERGAGILPACDLRIIISVDGRGRVCELRANTTKGEQLLETIEAKH